MKNNAIPLFAVFGNPIAHSLSPEIHQHFAKQAGITLTYQKILVQPEVFEQEVLRFFEQGGKGLNITAPFKEKAYALATQHTPRCQQAGSANTLWMEAHQLHADNTDGIGLTRDLSRYVPIKNSTIAILGAGGAVRGIVSPLLEMQPARIFLVNRTLAKARALQQIFPQIALGELPPKLDIMINATSAPHAAFPDSLFHPPTFYYDLSYQAEADTPFVAKAKIQGCKAVDGLGMLVEQAAEAFRIWHGDI